MASAPIFPINSRLNNPKFNSYKLTSLPSVSSINYKLPGSSTVTQVRSVHGYTTLSFNEVQSRIRHDHLGAGFGGWVTWVDEAWDCWAAKLHDDLTPNFCQLPSIPAPNDSPSSPPSEYPSIHSLSPTTYVASDGRGRLYPLHLQPSATALTGTLGTCHELTDDEGELRPFKVEWVGGSRLVLISSAVREREGGGWSKSSGFDLMLCHFSEEEGILEEGDQVKIAPSPSIGKKLKVMWTVSGSDVPSYAYYSEGRFILGSTSTYSLGGAATSAGDVPMEGQSALPLKHATTAYSWTQSSDSLTLTISLIPDITTKSISISLLPKQISIKIDGSPLAGFEERTWWDSIKSSESTWTYDKSDGILTVEIFKSNSKTRWPTVFTDVESSTGLTYEQPLETLLETDASNIRDNLSKFTSDEDNEKDDRIAEIPDLLPGGISSLLREEMDIDDEGDDEGLAIDGPAKGGNDVYWTFVGGDGVLGEGGNVSCTIAGREGAREVLLGKPLVPTKDLKSGAPPVLIKQSLDGLIFSPPTSVSSNSFIHSSTLPALSYVLSSKRDTRFILHTIQPPYTILAFETPNTEGAGGNLFIYYDSQGSNDGKQIVLKAGGDDTSGALLGVKAIASKNVVVCLCEKSLLVLSGILE